MVRQLEVCEEGSGQEAVHNRMRIVQVLKDVLELSDLESVLQLADAYLAWIYGVRILLDATLKLEDVDVIKIKSVVNGLLLAIG